MFEEIKDILLEQLDIREEEITLESNLVEDFKADSLDLMELATFVEEKYNINISKEDIKKIIKVKDIIEIIKLKKG